MEVEAVVGGSHDSTLPPMRSKNGENALYTLNGYMRSKSKIRKEKKRRGNE